MKRPIAVLILLLALAVPAAPLAAAATTAGAPTTMRITFSRSGGGRFTGTVRSPSAECVAGRKVTVYRKTGKKRTPVGSGSSAAGGAWQVSPRGGVAAGSYDAATPAVTRGATTCGAAKSVTTRAS